MAVYNMSNGRKKEISNVWKYYTKSSSLSSNADCKFCYASISRGGINAIKKGFTTTNLWNHVRRFHSEQVEESARSQSDSDCKAGPTPRKQVKFPVQKHEEPKTTEITRLIAEEICLDMEPLNRVNKIGFQRLISGLCPGYEMVSTSQLSQTVLPDMYVRVKSQVKLELNNSVYLCITIDLWSSDFISLTARGLNENFETKNLCLEILPFEGESHSAELISQNLVRALADWNIVDKVKVIITDIAENIVNAVDKLPDIDHFPCAAQSLQLVLHDAVFEHEDVKTMASTARKIVEHLSHSTQTDNILTIRAAPEEHATTYLMLQRLNDQRAAVQTALRKLDVSCDLNTQQWTLLQRLVEILKYFEEVIKALSKDEATIADTIPLVNSLFKVLESAPSEPQIESIKLKLTERFGTLEENENCVLATALDPRYKLRVFRHQSTIVKTRELLYCAIKQVQEAEQQDFKPFSDVQPSTSTGIWSVCQQIIDNVNNGELLAIYSKNQCHKKEVNSYLLSPNIPQSSDIFSYWKNCYEFPRLRKLAMKCLSCKPTLVNSENLFPTASRAQSPKRNKSCPQNFQMLHFLNKNLPAVNFEY